MPTTSLKLRRGGDGYYRTSWVDDSGQRHSRSFGKKRDDAWARFREFTFQWNRSPRIRNPDAFHEPTIREAFGLLPGDPAAETEEERLHGSGFRRHARTHYRRRDGTQTGEATNFEEAMGPVLELFGHLRPSGFAPPELEQVQQLMIALDISLGVINARTRRIRQVWRWFVAKGICEVDVLNTLKAMLPLSPGRCDARVTDKVEAVPDALVDAVLEHVPPTLAAMIRLQWLTGMRPGEVTIMRPVDIDTTGPTWIYTPFRHKNEHRRMKRKIPLGARAKAIVEPFLAGRALDGYLFTPAGAMAERGLAAGSRLGERYNTQAYGFAIAKVCREKGIAHWSPNQLRHNLASRVRREYGLEDEQAMLGHGKTNTADIYDHTLLERAIRVAEKVG